VLIVPGAGVYRYARPAVEALRSHGVDTKLLAAPGTPDGPADLRRYGEELVDRIAVEEPVELLVGLSVGPRRLRSLPRRFPNTNCDASRWLARRSILR
jgi:hypothetical protein